MTNPQLSVEECAREIAEQHYTYPMGSKQWDEQVAWIARRIRRVLPQWSKGSPPTTIPWDDIVYRDFHGERYYCVIPKPRLTQREEWK